MQNTQLHFAEIVPSIARSKSIEEAFNQFHALNPYVYANLVALAMQMHARGRKRIGMKMLFELLRWNHMLHTQDNQSEYKLCNNYTSRYARLIMENETALDGIFATRKLTA